MQQAHKQRYVSIYSSITRLCLGHGPLLFLVHGKDFTDYMISPLPKHDAVLGLLSAFHMMPSVSENICHGKSSMMTQEADLDKLGNPQDYE